MTITEKAKFEAWIITNVDESIVPADEGNGKALVFNLIHLLRGDGERYNYAPKQDAELKEWGLN